MESVSDAERARLYRKLLEGMTLQSEHDKSDFNPEWLRSHDWKVVPVESAARLPLADLPRLVGVLAGFGCKQCVAVATEPLGDMPDCYMLSVDVNDFLELNRTLGVFRFLLTDEHRSWAISCTEWYNLFSSTSERLEKLLGKTIDEARTEYLKFASDLSRDRDEPLLQMARHYASLK